MIGEGNEIAEQALRRIASATAKNTNTVGAADALSWCRAVAESALDALVSAWFSLDQDGQSDATTRADRAEDWHRLGRTIIALVPARHEAETVAWLSIDVDGQRDATTRADRIEDWKRYGRQIIPLALSRSNDAAAKPYCWVRETPGHFDPCHGGESPSVEFLTEEAPGSFPLFKGAGSGSASFPQVTISSEAPPLPYSISELEKICASKLGLTAMKTRDVLHELYAELRVITYPLSDCGYLPDYLREDVPQIMSALSMTPGMEVAALESDLTLNAPSWNEAELQAHHHHGIIPTTDYTSAKRKTMTPIQRDVFDLIAWNFIAQFYPACVSKTVTAKIIVDGEIVETTGSTITDRGWRDVLDLDGIGSSSELRKERALEIARRAYESKERDAFGPTPTEHPEDGGGPLGYAIRAYLKALDEQEEQTR